MKVDDAGPGPAEAASAPLTLGSLRVSRPIVAGGAPLATLWITADMARIHARTGALARIVAVVLFGTRSGPR